MPAGRPTLFTEKLAKRILGLAKRGKPLKKIAQLVGVSEWSLSTWTQENQEFRWDLNEARSFADELVEKSLFSRAVGYTYDSEELHFTKTGRVIRAPIKKHFPPDVTAQIFWLKCRQPEHWTATNHTQQSRGEMDRPRHAKNFYAFCLSANYPAPYEKQKEMMHFGMIAGSARLLLGSRGYGKTDYVTILGVAYRIYKDWTRRKSSFSCLLITKSDERNSAILAEVVKACEANGVRFEKTTSSSVRVEGCLGKDHTLSAVTIGTSSLRGRHPFQIIMEDVVTPEDESEATRKKTERVYSEASKLTKNILVIGQPVHKQDLYGKLRPLLRKMEVPYGSIPELDHDLEAQRLAGVSTESIQASYYLTVVSDASAPLENVKFIDSFPDEGTAIAFIDPSFEGGDFTALSIAKRYFDGIAVQGYVYKKAWNHCFDEMCARMVECNVRRVAFETNSLGDQPIIMLREALPQGIGAVGIKSNGFKHSRIVNAGNYAPLIHISKTSDRAYIEQIIYYEYGAKHDDAPDSLASLMKWLGMITGKLKA